MSKFQDLFDATTASMTVFDAQGNVVEGAAIAGNKEDLEEYVLGLEAKLQAVEDQLAALRTTLIACFNAAVPRATPWIGTPQEQADYVAQVLPEKLRGLVHSLAAVKDQRDAALAALDNCNKEWTDALESVRQEMNAGVEFENPFLAASARKVLATLEDRWTWSAILAARDARQRAAGKVEALEGFLEYGKNYYLGPYTGCGVEIRRLIEAARKEAQG